VYEAGETLAGAIAWLDEWANVQAGTPYFIRLTGDETLNSRWYLYNADLNLTLEGAGETRTINAAGVPASHTVIVLGAGTLTLGNNLTLDGGGRAGYGRLIEIGGGATLNLTGATITGNNSTTLGGAVYSSGTFTMSGGAITGNSSTGGGGAVHSSGTFTMSGGVISGNSSTVSGGAVSSSGTFTMTGGAITGNSSTVGGGVWMSNGCSFTMTGGAITGNTAERGGGVNFSSGTIIHVDGGTISGNIATDGPTFGKQVFQSPHYIDVADIAPPMTVDNWVPGGPSWEG
jgi:predicted outer membrane repeat protein